MKIRVVNPNTTAAMTATIAAAARGAASPGTDIVAVTAKLGPASIEGYFDEAASLPGLLAEIAAGEAQGVDGHIVACFDDTGVDAARCLARAPVVGIGEAAFHLASLVARRFSVITTLSRSIGAIEDNLVRYGLDRRCAKVRACELPVLSLEEGADEARAKIGAEISRALADDRAEAIVLGCAGMADFTAFLSREHGLPVIEGVGAAVTLLEALARLGLATAKTGAYAAPRRKRHIGPFANILGSD